MGDDISIWTALADPKRRQIINLLEEKPRTTSDLSKYFDVSRFAVMKHLKVLEQADLITSIRQGRTRWNYLNEDLAHFLRTKLADGNGNSRLVELLGLFPGQKPANQVASAAAIPLSVEHCLLLQAAPAKVFEVFTIGIDSWWNQHAVTYSRIVLEPTVNGRLYEAFGAPGQGILYATVTSIKQDEELRLRGTVELAERVANTLYADNHVFVTFEPQQGATLLHLNHFFAGRVDELTAETTRHFWRQLLDRHFQPAVEKGLPYQHNP
jgi:DNA-binding transcriptional ArsR family regulator/uncharacterized protein YndB with AHSA1/START domain